MAWLNILLQGTLIGGLYALFAAAGLSLIFGVMRLVNIAHGDLIVLAAYLALVVVWTLGIAPLAALVVVVPVMFGLGYLLQRGLLNFTLGVDILPPLLVTFGLSVIIQNALLEGFSADSRRLQAGALETASLAVTDQISIGLLPAIVLGVAVAVIVALEFLLYRTRQRFPSNLRRSGDRCTVRRQDAACVRAGDGDLDGGGLGCRRADGGPHQF